MSPALRWTVLVPATATAFVAAGVAGSVLGSVLGVWGEPLIGAFTAGAFVAVPFWIAPSQRRLVATAALVVGAALAWRLVGPPSSYPEGYGELAYQPTYLPIVATYVAGAVTWTGCVLLARAGSRGAIALQGKVDG